jgi:hypothetical protein
MKHTAKRMYVVFAALMLGAAAPTSTTAAPGDEFRRLPLDVFRDKMAAAWVGQMAGVGWGGPTEFKWKGQIIPADKLPQWRPSMINQFRQDDIYVEMTFLRTLEVHGFDCSLRQAGIDFANSGYALWHANRAGRDNLRRGIAPPDSSHPEFNTHADDIDYQIEADYSGIIAPGLPNAVIALGEKFGRLMNYGDGVYGGQFVGGMYAEAYFEDDPVKIVEAGLKCIPAQSQYAEAIRDTLKWFQENPDDWEKTWKLIDDKYHLNPEYRRFSCSGERGEFNIDAKINGAYIVMGILYGKRDLDQTIVISTRCGQDSDCNPSNAAGVIFATYGMQNLPERYTSELNRESVFSHTEYSFTKLIDVCEQLARDAAKQAGGKIEKGADGQEVLVIPVQQPKPSPYVTCWEPGPIANSEFTEEELDQIYAASTVQGWQKQLDKAFAGWKLDKCGPDMQPGLRSSYEGRQNVFMSHPLNENVACVLSREVAVPANGKTMLKLVVGRDTRGDFTLQVKAGGEQLLEEKIGPHPSAEIWHEFEVDLSKFAGKTVLVELINKADAWKFEAAYWAEISVETK